MLSVGLKHTKIDFGWGLHCSPNILAGGEGTSCPPLPKNPIPASARSPSGLAPHFCVPSTAIVINCNLCF